MKKLLLVTSFVVLGSSLVGSETKNDDNNRNERSENIIQPVPQNSKQLLYNFIKENSLKTAGTTLALGTFLAVPFISLKTKALLGTGVITGAGCTLQAVDKTTYNELKTEAINVYTTIISPKCTEIKDTIVAFYNENVAGQKKD